MSHNKSDWYNPNNPAFQIRQSQLRSNRGGFTSNNGSYYSSSNYGCGNYNHLDLDDYDEEPKEKTLEEFVNALRPKEREGFEAAFNFDFEKNQMSLTFESVLAIVEHKKRRERNLREMFGGKKVDF